MEENGTCNLKEKYIKAFMNALNKLYSIKNIAHKKFLKGKKISEKIYCNQMKIIKEKESELKKYLCALRQEDFDIMRTSENNRNEILKIFNDCNYLNNVVKELLAFDRDKNEEIKNSLENNLEEIKENYQNIQVEVANKIKKLEDKREEYNILEEKITIYTGIPLNMLKKEAVLYVPGPRKSELLKYVFKKKFSTSIYPVYPEIEFYNNYGFCLLDNGDALFVGGTDSIYLFRIHFDEVGMVKILPLFGDFNIPPLLGDFKIPLSHLGQGSLINDFVYFFGSCEIVNRNEKIFNSCLRINLKSYENSKICDFPGPLHSASTQVIKNKIWIAHPRSSILYIYNTQSNSYSLFVRNLPIKTDAIINKILIHFKSKIFVITHGRVFVINLKNDQIENLNIESSVPSSLATYPVNRGKFFFFVLRNGDCLRFNCLTCSIKKLN